MFYYSRKLSRSHDTNMCMFCPCAGSLDSDMLELDASLSCPGRRDSSCAEWDHTVQLFVCCDQLSPYCNMELGRWITAFRRSDADNTHHEKYEDYNNEASHRFY